MATPLCDVDHKKLTEFQPDHYFENGQVLRFGRLNSLLVPLAFGAASRCGPDRVMTKLDSSTAAQELRHPSEQAIVDTSATRASLYWRAIG